MTMAEQARINAQNKMKVLSSEKTEEKDVHSNKTVGKELKTMLIPLSLIVSRRNIRKEYNQETLNELADSMKEDGQIQPITVAENDDGTYTILTGHRRYEGAKLAKLANLECVIRPDYETEIQEIVTQLIENEVRENITPEEKEQSIERLLSLGLTGTEICKRVHKSKSWLSRAKDALAFRKENGEEFKKAGISLTTDQAYNAKGADPADVKQALEELLENPEKKSNILNTLGKKAPKKETGRPIKKPAQTAKNEEKRTTTVPSTPTEYCPGNNLVESDTANDNEEDFSDSMNVPVIDNTPVQQKRNFTFKQIIILDDENKTFSVQCALVGEGAPDELNSILYNAVLDYYKNEGYDEEE